MPKAEIIAGRYRAGAWLTAFGAAVIAIATLTPSADTPGLEMLCIVCGDRGGVDTFLNLLLFAPFGFGLGLAGLRARHSLALVIATTLVIEALQVRLVPGRDATVGDVLMNTLGGTLGLLCAYHRARLIRPRRRAAVTLAGLWAAIFLGVMLLGSYALVPVEGTLPYYGQIARDLGPQQRGFPGTVQNPSIGIHIILDHGFAPVDVPALLARTEGVVVGATVVPAGCPPTTAGILSIADSRQHGILILAQRGLDVTYGIRTGADVLRLRPFRYRLERVFGELDCSPRKDTIALAARLSRSSVSMQATSASMRRALVIPRRVMETWRLVTPWQTFASEALAARWVSALWTVLLTLPLAYWSRFALSLPSAAASAAILLIVGFVLVPGLFDVPGATSLDWIVAGTTLAVSLRFARPAMDHLMGRSPSDVE